MTCTTKKVKSSDTVLLTIKQGTRFAFRITIRRPSGWTIDLSDFTGRGVLRRLKERTSTLLATFTVAVVQSSATLLVLDVSLGATVTRLLGSTGYFDIEIVDTVTPDPDQVYRVLQGSTQLDLEVTD